MIGLLKIGALVYIGWYLRDISSPETVATMNKAQEALYNEVKAQI